MGFALDLTQFDGAFTSADGSFGTTPYETPVTAHGTPSTFRLVDLLGTEFSSTDDPDASGRQSSEFEQDGDDVTRFRTRNNGLSVSGVTSTTQTYTFGVTFERRTDNDGFFFDSESGRLVIAADSFDWSYYDGSWRTGPEIPAGQPISAIYELDAAAGQGRIYVDGTLAVVLPYSPTNLGGDARVWGLYSSNHEFDLDGSVYRQFLIDRLLTDDEFDALDYWLRSVIDPALQPPDSGGGSGSGDSATTDAILLSGDAQSGTDAILLSGDAQSGTDYLKVSETV